MTQTNDQYAVVGNPISHSKSPQIHTEFAAQTQQQMDYQARLIELDQFDRDVTAFFSQQGRGLNVTVPFKEQAYAFADQHSQRAQRAGAVNTLIKQNDGSILADNTDGAGLVRDITVNQGVSISGKRVLLLGAGGAVRGVCQPILAEHPQHLVIANRTVSKALALAEDFSDLGPISGCGFAQVEGSFDLIINGTSASLAGDLPPVPPTIIGSQSVCYDMMYSQQQTVFNQWAEQQGAATTIDGLGMLVEQAAESFFLWRGVRPDTRQIMQRLRTNAS